MKVRLGDYIKEYTVRNKSLEDIPVYSVTNREGFCTGYFDKDVASQERSTYKIVPKGCFAYNPSRINVGSVDWQRHLDRVIVSPLYVVFSVSPDLLPQYLFYFLKSDISLTFIRSAATGSVRDNLKFSMLQEFPIEIRTVEKQAEIVAILDKVKAICDLYQRKLDILDKLIKARFVEMFSNRGYTLVKLGKVCSRITDGTHKTPTYLQDGVTFISAKNIINGELNFSDVKYISEAEYQEIQNRCQTERLDILLSKSGSLGSPAIVRTEIKLGLFESLAVLKYDRKQLLPEFLCEQLKTESIQRQFTLGTKGVAIKHLHLGVIADTDIIIPPISEQKEFADFVKQVDKSKVVVQKALDEAKLLFDSLMQKYFC